jgi:hypothetical protein
MGKRKLSVFLGCVLLSWPLLLPLIQDSTKECNYVASKFSIYYHLPTCKKAKRIQKQNAITFASAEEAVKAGYRPCGLCKPPNKDTSKEILKIPVPTN